MRFIKKQFALWRLVLIIGVAAIAIPIAAHVSQTALAVVDERQEHLDRQAGADNADADAKHSNDSKAAVGRGVERLQDDYYDRRRRYWEDRVERDLDEDDDADTKDKKDSKAGKDDGDDDAVDQEEDAIERRREYWRDRLDKEW
jgi:hypothetical protein